MAKAQVTTIRAKLLKIGAPVVVSVRRIYLSLASGHPLQTPFRQTTRRLTCTSTPRTPRLPSPRPAPG